MLASLDHSMYFYNDDLNVDGQSRLLLEMSGLSKLTDFQF